MPAPPDATAPVAPQDRFETLDVLRGMALFGVFLMNFVFFAQYVMSTETQMLSLPTVGLDAAVRWVSAWLFGEKANTLFAFLFGLGFSIQMQRLTSRGARAGRVALARAHVPHVAADATGVTSGALALTLLPTLCLGGRGSKDPQPDSLACRERK